MEAYYVRSTEGQVAGAALLLLVGGGMVIGVMLGLRADVFSGVTGILIAVGLVILALVLVTGAVRTPWSVVCEIETYDDGTIVFVAPWRRICIAARDISLLDETCYIMGPVFQEIVDPNPEPIPQIRWLLIEHSKGRLRLLEFDRAKEFAERVRALNPDVEIIGMWPKGQPPTGEPAETLPESNRSHSRWCMLSVGTRR